MRHIAHEGRCFLVSACQWLGPTQTALGEPITLIDRAADVPIIGGGSIIVSPMGEVLAGPLRGGEGLLVAEVDLADIVRAQIARNAPALLEPAERTMAAILATGEVPAGLPRDQQVLFPPYAGPFLQSVLSFDPAKALAGLDLACLLLQGGADRQVVPMGDVQPLIDALGHRGASGGASGEAEVFPAVSHSLKRVAGPTDPGFAGPLAPAVGDKLVSWLRPLLGA